MGGFAEFRHGLTLPDAKSKLYADEIEHAKEPIEQGDFRQYIAGLLDVDWVRIYRAFTVETYAAA